MGTEPARIEARLSAFDTTMVVVSLVIGIGIFRTPAMVAAGAGTSALFFAAWTLGGVVSQIAMILVLGGAALLVGRAPEAATTTAEGSGSLAGFVAACVAVFYAYGGYQNTMNVGGDVRNPRRSLPLAVTSGVVVVIALYLFVNLGYHRVLGVEGVAGAKLVAAAVARAAFGTAGESIVSLAIFLSAAGFVNATILQVPRSYYAMAEDGALPRAFLRVNPRTQVQQMGLLFFGATMLLPVLLLGSFEKLLGYVMFTDSLMLVVVASTVFVLRRRGAGGGEAFRAPGHPVLPAVFILCLLGVAGQVALTETPLALAGTAILLAGWPLFHLARRASASIGP